MTETTSRHDDLDLPIWGAKAIGKHINRTKRQTHHLLSTGKVDATKVGPRYTSTKRRLNRSLGVEAT